MIFIILQKLLYHLSKQSRPLLDIISSTICFVFTLDLHCLTNSFLWVLGIIGLLKWLCSNNVEMSYLSALMVYSSVNNLSVISGVSRMFGLNCSKQNIESVFLKDITHWPQWVSNKWPFRYYSWLNWRSAVKTI